MIAISPKNRLNGSHPFSSLVKVGGLILTLAATALLSPLTVDAAVTTFTPGSTIYKDDLSAFSGGKTAKDLGWGGGKPEHFVGEAPSGSGYSGSIVIGGIGTETSSTANGPSVTLPTFSNGEKIFISSSFYATNVAASGARLFLRADGANYVGGFGLTDTSQKLFTLQTAAGVNYSQESYIANHWYELALVIELHETDISLSIGSLFVRDLTLGETEFRLVEGLNGINMGYTSSRNLNDFTYFRLERFRYNAQMGEITIGQALEVIPEPTTAALTGIALLIGGVHLLRRKSAARLP